MLPFLYLGPQIISVRSILMLSFLYLGPEIYLFPPPFSDSNVRCKVPHIPYLGYVGAGIELAIGLATGCNFLLVGILIFIAHCN
jgi:hypothetical protein